MINIKYMIFTLCVVLHGAVGIQIRLVGDATNKTGRVELFDKGQWYKLSQRYITYETIKVICRTLGFGDSGIAVRLDSSIFHSDSGGVIKEGFRCIGNETDVSQCQSGVAVSNYDYPLVVSCEGTRLRLVDGDTASSGRVEVYIKGGWHTICDSKFDGRDARVICSMLGYADTGIAWAFHSSTYGNGVGNPVLTDLGCNGDENDIKLCGGSWSSTCNHRSDAGVKCGGTPIRLVNGPDTASGRVEILHAGEWGTVCGNDYFSSRNAMVICRMLGFNTTNAFGHSLGFYGQGDGHVIASYPACDGTEDDIAQCTGVKWRSVSGYELCNHDKDVGVNCNGKTHMRLVNGFSKQSGRLEVLHGGYWGTVGYASFDRHDLKVVCRMLGHEYSEKSFYMSNGYFGYGTGNVIVTSLQCFGNERDIALCQATWWPSTYRINHDHDIGISCDGDIPIRLVNGHTNATGRVELLHNGFYETVCDSGFDRFDLIVICRMLGFNNIPPTAYWHTDAYHGEGLGEILVSGLSCNGNEPTIGLCGGYWPAGGNCDHSDDLSVSCDGIPETLRLVDGQNNHSGRVEILHNGQWGRICSQDFDRLDAVVLCRLLNFSHPETALAYRHSKFGEGNGTYVLSAMRCNGVETVLEQCSADWLPGSCSTYYKEAGVDCCPSCSAPQIIG